MERVLLLLLLPCSKWAPMTPGAAPEQLQEGVEEVHIHSGLMLAL